jgi:hypothetical protein
MRVACYIAGVLASALCGAAQAQTYAPDAWDGDASPGHDITAQLNGQPRFAADDPSFGPAVRFQSDFTPEGATSPYAAAQRRDIWRESPAYSERLSVRMDGVLRRADGSPLPVGLGDAATFEADQYDVSYVRAWPAATGRTASGLEVSLTPHAGVGAGSRGGSAEAGATLRVGSGLERMVPEGADAFGDRSRWYLYAAGSGRAVGYNFARNRDGDFARSGYSHDSGSFLGDASLGVAFRKGDVQSSFGLVYREIEAEGLRSGRNFDNDVTEGLVAFQLSIKPEW